MQMTLSVRECCTITINIDFYRGVTWLERWKTRDAGYRSFSIAPSLSTRSEFLEKPLVQTGGE